MITPVEAYSGSCDHCGASYQQSCTGFTIFTDESQLLEAMEDENWYVDHNTGKQYCEECKEQHIPEEDDEYQIDSEETE